MSRVWKNSSACDNELAGNASSSTQGQNENYSNLDHEIFQLTKLRSAPHKLLSRDLPGRLKLPVSTVRMLFGREGNYSGKGRFSSADGRHVLSRYLPVNGPTTVDRMMSRAYISQFSVDGTLFIAGYQGNLIKVYNVNEGWKTQKNILAEGMRWAITDTCLSPDQRFLVYSSMSPIVHLVDVGSATTNSVANVTEIHEGLSFSRSDDDYDEFGIFSVKFSRDGREIVAASGDNAIYVYDLPANKCSLRIPAHKDDVNTVCFADDIGHLIYSGSDDNLCKVWDKRCLTRGKPVGVLMGHVEGITFIDSRGDGRYFISNGKDQTTKLWDIRRMSCNIIYDLSLTDPEWDYRWMEHARTFKHPHDQSVATYRGHSILRTLIRCYFSPEYSTGQKYIYTGSADCCVYIYDLVSGAQVARLDHHCGLVRDCSWHPCHPMIVSSAWDGIVFKWEFPGRSGPPAQLRRRRRRPVLHEYFGL